MMNWTTKRLARRLAVAQAAIVSALGIALIVAPPQRGAMLIVPIDGAPLARTVDWARGAGASILGAGPTPSSLVVMADRGRLIGGAFAHRSLLLAAPAAVCGALIAADETVVRHG